MKKGYQLLKVGIIVDNNKLGFLPADLIKRSLNTCHYNIECLIIQDLPNHHRSYSSLIYNYIKRKSVSELINRLSYGIISKIESFLVSNNKLLSSVIKKNNVDDYSITKIFVKPEVSKNGYTYKYRDEDLIKIISQQLDVLVLCGSGILKDKILEICPFGVISYHHGDNNVFRGGPPGFWESFHRAPSTGFIIQKLNNNLDGGMVLAKGAIPTYPIFMLNQARIYLKSAPFLDLVLKNISINRALRAVEQNKPYFNRIFKVPSFSKQVIYIFQVYPYFALKLAKRLLGIKNVWAIAYGMTDEWKASNFYKLKSIAPPSNRFYADPFIIYEQNRHICYFEDFSFVKNKACISALEITNKGPTLLGECINETFHLSFPYVFKHSEQLYMCPESSENRDIRIYKSTDFPLGWDFHSTVIKDVSAADSIFFEHNGKLWLFTNIDTANMNDHNSELHIFYTDSADLRNWVAHPTNPVIFDSNQARNAGFLRDGEKLYRVFQRHGFNLYGEKFGIAEIVTLNENHYKEEIISIVEPNFFKNIKGSHTASHDGHILFIDFLSERKVK
jgi:hypothetical protein